jgi:hypothetical protein
MVILCKNFYLVYKKGGRDKFFQNLYIERIRKWQRKNAGTYFSKFKHCKIYIIKVERGRGIILGGRGIIASK